MKINLFKKNKILTSILYNNSFITMKNTFRIFLFLLFGLAVSNQSCKPKQGTQVSKEVKEAREYLQNTYTEIKGALNEFEVTLLQDSIKVIFKGGMLFESGESNLKPEILDGMARFSSVFNKYPKNNMIIVGYSDNTGSFETNKILSYERSIAVESEFIKNNVLKERMNTVGMGSSNPIAPNDSDENRAKNRRVELVILYNFDYK